MFFQDFQIIMALVWRSELFPVRIKLDDITRPPFDFSAMSARQKKQIMAPVHDTFMHFLEKVVGPNKNEKSAFLLFHLKRLNPEGGHLKKVISDQEALPNYSNLTKNQRKSFGKSYYKIFDSFVQKSSGSTGVETQTKFLDARFFAVHHEKENFKPLARPTQDSVESMIHALEPSNKIPYNNLSRSQKNRNERKARYKVLEKMIVLAAGSEDIDHQESLLNDCIKRLHPGFDPYSWKRLGGFLGRMSALEKFENTPEQNLRNRYKYPFAVKLVDLLSGCSKSGSIRTAFIRAKFAASRMTQSELLNPDVQSKLQINPKTKRPLEVKLWNLVKRFC